MDKRLYKKYKGRTVARTCEPINPITGKLEKGCGAVLSISNYNTVICERCEEPQLQEYPER